MLRCQPASGDVEVGGDDLSAGGEGDQTRAGGGGRAVGAPMMVTVAVALTGLVTVKFVSVTPSPAMTGSVVVCEKCVNWPVKLTLKLLTPGRGKQAVGRAHGQRGRCRAHVDRGADDLAAGGQIEPVGSGRGVGGNSHGQRGAGRAVDGDLVKAGRRNRHRIEAGGGLRRGPDGVQAGHGEGHLAALRHAVGRDAGNGGAGRSDREAEREDGHARRRPLSRFAVMGPTLASGVMVIGITPGSGRVEWSSQRDVAVEFGRMAGYVECRIRRCR